MSQTNINSKPRSEEQVIVIMKHAIAAVHYLHSLYVLHLDIKLANFIIVDNVVKLIDFTGVIDTRKGLNQFFMYTQSYLPPGMQDLVINLLKECKNLQKPPASTRNDIWALGIMFWELVNNRTCLQEYDATYLHNTIPQHISKECRDLIKSCLCM